ncbi:MAG TPA: glycosyltransferase [Kiritimatiellia bacterium]|nr:glycosyltransferase [Kiritimatiellia bacterium]HMO99020.1 glycosyltransferase [Kiritimatiellia bacterium]HMP95907.1 glycosyltransferase [Kiritimatiellia bacterium]
METTFRPEQNNPPRDIAVITIYPPPGSHHSSAKDLSALAAYSRSLLQALPIEVRRRVVVLTNIKEAPPRVYHDEDIEVREAWAKGRAGFFFQIIRALRALPTIRIVHLQHEFNQFGGAFTVPLIPLLLWLIRLVYRKKIVITYHEVMGNEMLTPELVKKFCLPVPSRPARVLFKAYYRITSRAAHTLLVQHQKFKDRLKHEIGVGGHIEILPIGTEQDAILADQDASRNALGFAPNDRILLFFGTLDWRKGLDVLLEAFRALPDPNYRLVIGGGQPVRIKHRPEYQQWYQGIAAGMAADPRVRHIGFVADDDIPKLFAACDLVVLPYVVPQMVSAVLNHAASYERPYIASNAFAGHADPLVLFQATSDELGAKISWALSHTEELLAYARRYKREMSWINSASLLSRYYADTLARK